MSKQRSQLKNWLEFIALKALLWLDKLLPFAWSCWIGKQLGRLAYRILESRRRLTIENIRKAQDHGFLKGIEPNDLARRVWEHIGQVGSEFFYFNSRGFQHLKKRVTIVGEENLQRVLAKQHGAILITAHFGNWEVLGLYLAFMGYPLRPLVATQTNPLVDSVIQAQRKSAGIKVIPRSGFLRPIIKALRNNEIVPFLIDQAEISRQGVPVEFFGRTASFPPGAAEFALRTGTPVIFAYLVRERDNRYQVVISEEIENSQSGDYPTDLSRNVACYMKKVEEVIINYPEQWLWMHKLWATQIRV